MKETVDELFDTQSLLHIVLEAAMQQIDDMVHVSIVKTLELTLQISIVFLVVHLMVIASIREQSASRHHVVQYDSGTKYIGFVVKETAPNEFWCNISCSPMHRWTELTESQREQISKYRVYSRSRKKSAVYLLFQSDAVISNIDRHQQSHEGTEQHRNR